MLPFTHAQFIEVFARYNAAVGPAAVAAYLLAAAMLAAIAVPRRHSGRFVAGGLALMWLWTGVAYHAAHFSAINKAAYWFAALFVAQAILFLHAALAQPLRFGGAGKAAALAGWALVGYATVLYPLLGLAFAQPLAQQPLFGITPCPVTIFTFGVLLLADAPVARRLLAVPVLWSLVGGSAAVLLRVPQDWVLLLCVLALVPLARGRAPGPRASAALSG